MTKSDARPRQVTAALSFRVSDGGRMKKIDDDTRAGIVVESARRGVAGQKFVALQRKLMMLNGAEPKVHLLCADAAGDCALPDAQQAGVAAGGPAIKCRYLPERAQ